MKKLILTLLCFTLLQACGQLTPEQWAELEAKTSQNSRVTPNPTTSISSFQVDASGAQDLSYTVVRSSNQTYKITVNRARGTLANRTIVITEADSASLIRSLKTFFTLTQTAITSRVDCIACTTAVTLSINRLDSSIQIHHHPEFKDALMDDFFPSLNEFILSRI